MSFQTSKHLKLTLRKAILKEENAYFSFLAMGGLE
jgi:hypothetical protein